MRESSSSLVRLDIVGDCFAVALFLRRSAQEFATFSFADTWYEEALGSDEVEAMVCNGEDSDTVHNATLNSIYRCTNCTYSCVELAIVIGSRKAVFSDVTTSLNHELLSKRGVWFCCVSQFVSAGAGHDVKKKKTKNRQQGGRESKERECSRPLFATSKCLR